LFPAVRSLAERGGLSTRQATKSGCPPLLGADRVDRRRDRASVHKCAAYNQAMIELVREQRPKLVILAARWSLFTAAGDEQQSFIVDADSTEQGLDASIQAVGRSLERTVNAINDLGVPVLLVGQAPEFYVDPNRCYVRNRMHRKDVGPCIQQTAATAATRLGKSNEILAGIANGRPNVRLLRLDSLLCEAGTCSAVRNGEPLYNDRSHISLFAAQYLASVLQSSLYQELFLPLRISRQDT
jgi:hypothetical protein